MKVEGEKDVIVLSDKTVETHRNVVIIEHTEQQEEVNSPTVWPSPKVRCKLFPHEVNEAVDCESTTSLSVYFINVARRSTEDSS